MDMIANMLISIANAQQVGKERVAVPYSTFSESLGRFLQAKGAVAKVRVQEGVKPKLVIALQYREDGSPKIRRVKRVSKSGRRYFLKQWEWPHRGGRPGFYILSTSQGLMDEVMAKEAGVGGELIGEVWEV